MNVRFENDGDKDRMNLPSLRLVLLLVVVVFAAIFFFQNGHETEVEILAWTVTWPVRLVIIVSIALGVVLDRLGSWFWRRSRNRRREND